MALRLRAFAQSMWFPLTISFAIGIAYATALEWAMTFAPVPPGADPGNWFATAAAYVGQPYPSEITPLSYPPAVFPLLGVLALAGGGPAEGARLYIGLIAVLLGVSTYLLGKAVLRSPVSALFAEVVVLAFPATTVVFDWGGYPNLLGFVFMNLALAFGLTFVAQKVPWYAFVFWLAALVAVLSEALVAVVFVGTIALVALFLLWQRRLPREFLTNRLSQVGLAIFALGAGGYYIGTKFLGVQHPQYTATNPYAHQLGNMGAAYQPVIDPLTNPFHTGPSLSGLSASIALPVSIAIVVVALGALIALGFLRRRWLTPGLITVVAGLAVPVALAVIGWEISLTIKYPRFGYFMIIPGALLFILLLESLLRVLIAPLLERWKSSTPGPRASATRLAPRSWPPPLLARGKQGRTLFTVGVASAVVIMLLIATFISLPDIRRNENTHTVNGHDQAYLNALNSIAASGVPGSIFVLTPHADKWPRALLARSTYAPPNPQVPGSGDYYASQILNKELSYFAVTDRYAVSNGLLAASFSGTNTNPAFFNESPAYEPFLFGHPTPLIAVLPQSIQVNLAGHGASQPFGPGSPSAVFNLSGQSAGVIGLNETGPGYDLSITVAELRSPSAIVINVTAFATGSSGVTAVSASLAPENGPAKAAVQPSLGTFTWNPGHGTQYLKKLVTNGTVTPASSLLFGAGQATVGQPLVVLQTRSSTGSGASSLSFELVLTTPHATNIISADLVPTFLDSTAVWQELGARFVLMCNPNFNSTNNSTSQCLTTNTGLTASQQLAYLEGEYQAAELDVSGEWLVLLLPSNY